MLKKLLIKNFAIIDNIEINFNKGLNIIIGETGAGKSIIIGALQILLGERANTEIVRKNKRKAVIEAEFHISSSTKIPEILNSNNYDNFDEFLIIRREIFSKDLPGTATSRSFINDSPAQIYLIKEISKYLVDFHNQHDNHSLLKSENHLKILDKISILSDEKIQYIQQYQKLKSIISNLKELSKKESILKEKSDYLKFQLDEILKIDPNDNEDIELENQLKILQNSEFLFESSLNIGNLLLQNDNSVEVLLKEALNELKNLNNIDKVFQEYLSELESASITIKEVANKAIDYKNQIEFNPEKIEQIRLRLNELKILQKKYGSVDDAIVKKNELEKEINIIDNFDDEIAKLKNEIIFESEKLFQKNELLDTKRQENAKILKEFMVENLKYLGINHCKFETKFYSEKLSKEQIFSNICGLNQNYAYRANENGLYSSEFLISTNKGESPKPLAKIASGGELSRIMLSIKQIIAKNDLIPLFVFDEIDIGISGKIAQKVGISMKKLSENHQIISITHLPQIAALGDNIIVVKKVEDDYSTSIEVTTVSGDSKNHEIAKMIAGEKITEDAINSAKQLSLDNLNK